ncbi:MAG: putative dienelactone hydrolase [Myxococcota bacterium]|jgi:predicted dienelactone hydrolase
MLLLILSACSDKSDDTAQAVDPLTLSVIGDGPMNVGYRLVEQTYTEPTGESLTVPISIWYPTEETGGEAPRYFGIVEDTEAILDAAPAGSLHTGGYPVLIFSHGSFLYGASSSFLARHFASHGWVVAAPDHVGNTLTDYSDIPLPIYYRRPLNDRAAVDAVEAQADLSGADTARMVLAGYSFGGYDTWATIGGTLSRAEFEAQCKSGSLTDCTEAELSALEAGFADDRFVAAIPMAGAGRFEYFTDGGLADLTVPVMQMSGTEDHDNPQQMWDLSAGTPLSWVSIEGGCHEMFGVGGCPDLDREDGFSLIEAYALAFARHHLLGDEGGEVTGLLDGSQRPWDSVVLEVR